MKVAIIGGNDTYKTAPFGMQGWEIWSCNSLWKCCRKDGKFIADRWFEMHPMSVQTPEEEEAIRVCPVPIYTLEDESSWAPNSVKYPLGDILTRFGQRYFTCTFAYQIALALHEGAKEIGIYGVELWQGTARERTVERACTEFWMGIAIGMGVEVYTPGESFLKYQGPLYGYHYHEEVDYVNQVVNAICYVNQLRDHDQN